MNQWIKIRLGDIIETNKNTYSSKEQWSFVNYLDTGNIVKNKIDEIQYIDLSIKKLPSRAKRKVKYNSIIYSTVRPNQHHHGIIKEQPENFLVSTGFTVIDVNCEKANPDYIYYVLSQNEITEYLQGIGEQSVSAYPSIKPLDIENLEITLPKLEIQNKIVNILSTIDGKIKNNIEINNNLEQQAKMLFLNYLSNCNTSLTIGDISHEILDYEKIKSQNVKILNSSDITEGIFPMLEWVKNKNLKGHFKKRFKTYDILYSQIRPRNHHYGFVMFDSTYYIASTRLMVIRNIENMVYPFVLYQYLLLHDVETEFTLKTESRSGTFPQGNYDDMSTIRIKYSGIENQKQINNQLKVIRKVIFNNQMQNETLIQLRDSLLPKLMSGELDVSFIDL